MNNGLLYLGTMLFAWLGTISLCTIQLIMIRYGSGVNIWEVPEADLKEFLKVSQARQSTM